MFVRWGASCFFNYFGVTEKRFVMKSVKINTATILCFIAWKWRFTGENVVSLSLSQETVQLEALQLSKVNDLHTS